MNIQFPVSNWVNRLVFSCSVHLAIWFGCRHMALNSAQELTWFRCTAAAGALIPFHFWLVMAAIESDLQELRSSQRWRTGAFLVVAFTSAAIPFTEYFVPLHSTGGRQAFGPGYFVQIAGILIMYVALGIDGLRRLRSLRGSRRFALQVWLGGGGAAFVTIMLLQVLQVAAPGTHANRVQALIVLAFYAWTAFAITTGRVFGEHRFYLVGIEKAVMVAALAAAAIALYAALKSLVPPTVAGVTTTGLVLWLAVAMRVRLDRLFQIFPQAENFPQPPTEKKGA